MVVTLHFLILRLATDEPASMTIHTSMRLSDVCVPGLFPGYSLASKIKYRLLGPLVTSSRMKITM